MATLEELAERFRQFGSTVSKAPLYERLALAIADEPTIATPLLAAPETQQLPVLFFAAVHHLLLSGADEALAAHYPNIATSPEHGDPLPAFRAFCERHADEIAAIARTRNTQTNEVGRCASFLPGMAMVADECGEVAHVDIGTSAGLNLLMPQLGYRYSPGGTLHADAPVVLECGTRGDVPVPSSVPHIVTSIGVDMSPIDVFDDDAVRWLEACVWPDQTERFLRLVSAIAMARDSRLDVRAGDAVDMLEPTVREATRTGHPVVTNSWVLNYLPYDRRMEYLATLDRIGETLDLSWLLAEAPAQTRGLPVPTTEPAEEITVLALVRWRNGQRTVQRLATCHPHGAWLHWETSAH